MMKRFSMSSENVWPQIFWSNSCLISQAWRAPEKRTSVSFLKKIIIEGAKEEIKGIAMVVRRESAEFME